MKTLSTFMTESVKLKVGDWVSQEYNGIYGKVTEVRPNGKVRGVKWHPDTNKATFAFFQNWHPAAKVIDEKDVPPKVKAKINAKA